MNRSPSVFHTLSHSSKWNQNPPQHPLLRYRKRCCTGTKGTQLFIAFDVVLEYLVLWDDIGYDGWWWWRAMTQFHYNNRFKNTWPIFDLMVRQQLHIYCFVQTMQWMHPQISACHMSLIQPTKLSPPQWNHRGGSIQPARSLVSPICLNTRRSIHFIWTMHWTPITHNIHNLNPHPFPYTSKQSNLYVSLYRMAIAIAHAIERTRDTQMSLAALPSCNRFRFITILFWCWLGQ